MVSTNLSQGNPEIPEAHIAALLEHRYGKGMASMPRRRPDRLLRLARQHGFIDAQGLLTRKGRALLARYH